MPEAAEPGGAMPAGPRSLLELFWAFTSLAMQGFGGVLAVAQHELCVRRQWLGAHEFLTLLASAQVMPGPNVCNLSLMIGDRFFGWRGALVALAGMVSAPLMLMLALAWLLGEIGQGKQAAGTIQGALWGITAVAAGQIIGTVLKLAAPVKDHVLGWPVCAAIAAVVFGLVFALRWSLLHVLLGVGSLTCLWTYMVLRRRARA
jgi:chromate transporter